MSSFALRGVVFAILCLAISATPALATWTASGVPVVVESGSQDQTVAVSDGLGGMLVAWRDARSDVGDIYVQRLSPAGEAQWTGDGMALCVASGAQLQPAMVCDGRGGAIVAWQDERADAGGDIYAQRIDATGVVRWSAGGVALVSGPSRNNSGKVVIRMVPDGIGGAVLAFSDNRNADGSLDPSFSKVWLQRVSADGVARWGNGVPVSTVVYAHGDHVLVSDGAGGAIVAWMDGRVFGDYNISVQRVDSTGTRRWGADGVYACSASGWQWYPAMVGDGAGGVVVAWTDLRSDANGDVYAQRLDGNGTPQWTTDGVALVTGPSGNNSGERPWVQIASDGLGGAILSFPDNRNANGTLDPSFSKVWLQRVSGDGVPLWGNGTPVSTVVYAHGESRIVADGRGGAVVAWMDGRRFEGYKVSLQCVDAAGSKRWGADGVYANDATGYQWQNMPELVSDGLGGGLVIWTDTASNPGDVFAQRVTKDGVVAQSTTCATWTAAGVPVVVESGSRDQTVAVSDGLGGMLVAWRDARSDVGDIYVQRLSPAGEAQWTGDGMALCAASGAQLQPAMVCDGRGGAIVAWQDERADAGGDIYAQRIDATGVVRWSAGGVALVSGPSRNNSGKVVIRMVPDGIGGAVLAFSDNRNADGSLDPSFSKVWLQRVSADGVARWGNGVPVSTVVYAHGDHVLVSDGAGGAIVAWMDGRVFGDYNISVQRVDSTGTRRWGADGVYACSASGWQWYPAMVGDGAGGVVVAWTDLRSDANGDVYAQRLDGNGTPQWTTDGVALVTGPSGNNSGERPWVQIASDGLGGAILSFPDNRNANGTLDPSFSKVWLQRVSGDGVPLWGNGTPVSTVVYAHGESRIVADGRGGAVVAWMDGRRFEGYKVSLQCVDAAGSKRWGADGVYANDATGYQWQNMPELVSDGLGGGLVIWTDTASDPSGIYAARACGIDPVAAVGESPLLPDALHLGVPMPNPASDRMTCTFDLPRASTVMLEIIDITGRVCARLAQGEFTAGRHTLSLRPQGLRSGFYYLRVRSSVGSEARGFVLLK